jgi:nicotinic acid mononucleotide adenylyltransferase
MSNTTAFEVIQSFESSFADKQVLPLPLELEWLKKAIGRFSMELDQLEFDEEILEFDTKLDRYVIDTLATFMKQYYQERQVSLVNKRISIVGKDLSIDGSGNTKTSERIHLQYVENQAIDMVENQKTPAYN